MTKLGRADLLGSPNGRSMTATAARGDLPGATVRRGKGDRTVQAIYRDAASVRP